MLAAVVILKVFFVFVLPSDLKFEEMPSLFIFPWEYKKLLLATKLEFVPAQGLPRVFQDELMLCDLIWLLGVTGEALSEWMEPSHRKGMELDCLLIEM